MSDKPSTSKESAGPSLPKQFKTDSSKPAPAPKPSSLTILVNPKQKGNPLLKFMKNLPWAYSQIVPDYVMGPRVCTLFLSLRYHQLNPDYIHDRLKLLGNAYQLRVLLVQIDIPDPNHQLKNLTRICILADLTLMLAWSAEDAARIIETYKSYENKPPDMIMERPDSDPHQRIMNALTTIRSVNKTDAMILMRTFGSFEALLKATPTAICLCPGFGAQKAQRLYNVLHEPFLYSAPSKDTPGTSKDTPGTSKDTPGTSRDTPGTSKDTPGTSKDTPGPSTS
ncbi:DNA excision repair protein ERCC-1 [Diachasma alloeum]|uniref:DNA excision repair protein ERCC-1 n=1 Tax=Diachasma alloeum TaxID=454923 RepID=UPI0007384907|nr:DNA excision repair protein ERCC-1 [Diachasma alloeum]